MNRWARIAGGLALLAAVAYGVNHFTRRGEGPLAEAPSRTRLPPRGPPSTHLGRYPRSQFLIEHDKFLPADDPRTVAAKSATWLLPEDEIFGVVVGGQARAYPIAMIAYHHVVNDVIRGIPVAVTY